MACAGATIDSAVPMETLQLDDDIDAAADVPNVSPPASPNGQTSHDVLVGHNVHADIVMDEEPEAPNMPIDASAAPPQEEQSGNFASKHLLSAVELFCMKTRFFPSKSQMLNASQMLRLIEASRYSRTMNPIAMLTLPTTRQSPKRLKTGWRPQQVRPNKHQARLKKRQLRPSFSISKTSNRRNSKMRLVSRLINQHHRLCNTTSARWFSTKQTQTIHSCQAHRKSLFWTMTNRPYNSPIHKRSLKWQLRLTTNRPTTNRFTISRQVSFHPRPISSSILQ